VGTNDGEEVGSDGTTKMKNCNKKTGIYGHRKGGRKGDYFGGQGKTAQERSISQSNPRGVRKAIYAFAIWLEWGWCGHGFDATRGGAKEGDETLSSHQKMGGGHCTRGGGEREKRGEPANRPEKFN